MHLHAILYKMIDRLCDYKSKWRGQHRFNLSISFQLCRGDNSSLHLALQPIRHHIRNIIQLTQILFAIYIIPQDILFVKSFMKRNLYLVLKFILYIYIWCFKTLLGLWTILRVALLVQSRYCWGVPLNNPKMPLYLGVLCFNSLYLIYYGYMVLLVL